MKTKIIVVEDEKMKLVTITEALAREGYDVEGCDDGQSAWEKLSLEKFDIAVLDLRLPKVDGLELLKRIKVNSPETEVIMMTAYGSIENAVEAIKTGAHDYLTKPFPTEELVLKVDKIVKYQALTSENLRLRMELDEKFGLDNIVGKSKKMQDIYELIHTVAPGESTVVIYGESGTGKELTAHAIHRNSYRKNGPFIKVSCAVLAENLLESELFGHEKGAFTGALYKKPGRFELANGGTLFLDDVDDLSPLVQVKLLRVLQEREFERVGGTETIKVNVRLVAASKRDLEDAVKEGKFREDLYYRLNVITIHLPPLRERKDDIPLLSHHFLKKYAEKSNRRVEGFQPDMLSCFIDYEWPGNIRELENAVERAVALTKGPIIEVADLPQTIASRGITIPVSKISEKPLTIQEVTRRTEREYIMRVLKDASGHKGEAAKILGISRKTLWEKLKIYGLEI